MFQLFVHNILEQQVVGLFFKNNQQFLNLIFFNFPFWKVVWEEINDLNFDHDLFFLVQVFSRLAKLHCLLLRLKFLVLFMIKIMKTLAEWKLSIFHSRTQVHMSRKFDYWWEVIKTGKIHEHFKKSLFCFGIYTDYLIVAANFIKKPENVFLTISFCIPFIFFQICHKLKNLHFKIFKINWIFLFRCILFEFCKKGTELIGVSFKFINKIDESIIGGCKKQFCKRIGLCGCVCALVVFLFEFHLGLLHVHFMREIGFEIIIKTL